MRERKNSVTKHQAARLLSVLLALCLLLPGNIFSGFNFKAAAAEDDNGGENGSPLSDKIGAVINATKIIELDDGSGNIIPENEFTIKLEQVENIKGDKLENSEINPIYKTINTKDAVIKKINGEDKIAIEFEIKIPNFMIAPAIDDKDGLGEYFFKITEEQPDSEEGFWILNTEHVYVFSIVVWWNANGELEDAEGYVYDSEWDESKSPVIHKPIIFTNTYYGPEIAIVNIEKNITGKPSTDDEFTFNLKQVKPDGSEWDGEGINKSITIDSVPEGGTKFRFEIEGLERNPDKDMTYFFMVTEESGGEDSEWKYLGQPYIIAIIVPPTGIARVFYPSADGGFGSGSGPLVFVNEYPIPAEIKIKKTISGIASTNASFEFSLEQVEWKNSEWQTVEGGITDSVTTDGSITKTNGKELMLKADGLFTGDYFFRITEESVIKDGWKYSSQKYIIKVEVTDGTAVVYYPSEEGESKEDYNWKLSDNMLEFVNEYTPPSIEIRKRLASGYIGDEEFTFTVEELESDDPDDVKEDSDIDDVVIVGPIEEGDDKSELFEIPDLEPGKTYYYKITEKSKTNWTCDVSSYVVTVIVDADGEVTYKIDGEDADAPCVLEFENTYTGSELTLKKEVTGPETKPNVSFGFTVTFKDEDDKTVNGIIKLNGTLLNSGEVSVLSVLSGSSVKFTDIPLGTTYTIKEVSIPSGYEFVNFTDGKNPAAILPNVGGTLTGTIGTVPQVIVVVAVNKYNPSEPGEPGEPPEVSTTSTTAPPETTTEPPKTTEPPPQQTIPPPPNTNPPGTTSPPPGTNPPGITNPPPTTNPPGQTNPPPENTTAPPPDNTNPPPPATNPPGEPPIEPPPESPPPQPPDPGTPTEPPIDEPTTAPPTTRPRPPQPPVPGDIKPYEPDNFEDLKDNSTPLGNGWFAVELDDDWWEIFDENGTPIGVIHLPGGMGEYDLDYIVDNIKPLPKPNPQTGDSAVTIFGLLALAAAATVIFKKRLKIHDILHHK